MGEINIAADDGLLMFIFYLAVSMADKSVIILDTDIGDDIDDVLALGYILNEPRFELLGVTTVFGNTPLRARLAQTALHAAGRDEVPVAVGCGTFMSPRLDMPVDGKQNYLQDTPFIQAEAIASEHLLRQSDPRHAVDFIIDTVLARPGEITLVTIGAMTNLGMAIVKEPRISNAIAKVVAMAGVIDYDAINARIVEDQQGEWNIRCDPTAAAIVFNSGIPVDMVGLDVTTHVRFCPDDIAVLNQQRDPLSQVLSRCIDLFQQHAGYAESHRQGPLMHDPLAVVGMVEPTVMQWQRGTITVNTNWGPSYAVTSFTADPAGPHQYACTVDSHHAMQAYLRRVLHNNKG